MRSLRLYNTLLLILGAVAAPVAAVVCLFRPAWRRGLAARLGFGWPLLPAGDVLWAHASSVGEVEGIAPLIRRWREGHPDGVVVLSALTATGCDAARRLVPDVEVRAFPFDLPWLVRKVVRRVRPCLFLFSENEIWPNAIVALAAAGVPIVQVSGRLSAGTARWLARFPGLARDVLGRVSRFCVQEDEHRVRLLALGVSPARVVVTGSLKGADRAPAIAPFVAALGEIDRSVVVGGSTHPGEETALLDALAHWPDGRAPFLVLAPRHPERFEQVAQILARRRVATVRRSALAPNASDARAALARSDVLLLDCMGELAGCYTVAGAAFVGGTLVPVGGHNLLEAARAGAPIVVGPHHANVAPLVARLVAAGGAAVTADADELAKHLARFLDPVVAVQARSAARDVARAESGGLEATWIAIDDVARATARCADPRLDAVTPATAGESARAG